MRETAYTGFERKATTLDELFVQDMNRPIKGWRREFPRAIYVRSDGLVLHCHGGYRIHRKRCSWSREREIWRSSKDAMLALNERYPVEGLQHHAMFPGEEPCTQWIDRKSGASIGAALP